MVEENITASLTKQKPMGIKKIGRPINKAKNAFLKWLKYNNAECIDIYSGANDEEWDYYYHVDAFINDRLVGCYFKMWREDVKIDYYDDGNKHDNLSIDDFLQLIE